jgi:hypothetical protein
MDYKINDEVVAKKDYLDLFKKGEKYQVCELFDALGETMCYLSKDGKKISAWPLKEFELDIIFIKIN